jgi:4-hydroxybenzoate polyprenyltransferase
MYPLPQRALGAVLIYASLASQLARIHGRELGWSSGQLVLGSWAVFAFMLTLRLMDELKDLETDRELFPSRPLPSGRVRESDVSGLLRLVAALFLVGHVAAGWALATAGVALAYAFLMFRWFFVPERMRPDLPLTLATHNPVIPLLLLHLVTLFCAMNRLPLEEIRWSSVLVLVGAYWAGLFAWEIARKIRAPEQEDEYVTYSRLLGPTTAVAVAAGAQTTGVAAGLVLFAWHAFSPAFLVPLIAGYLVALAGHVRFLIARGPKTSRLRPFAEALLFGVFLGGVLA